MNGRRTWLEDSGARQEADWLARLRAGGDDEAVFHEIFLAYHARIFGYLRSLGHSPEDCEDLVQESFLRAYRNLRTYRGESDLLVWIVKIARNVHFERWRRRSAHKRSGEIEGAVDGPTEAGERPWERAASLEAGAQRNLLAKEELERTFEILEQMPEQMRRCFLLRFGEDMKYREIAEVMSISIQTVKSHLHQARARLREGLEA